MHNIKKSQTFATMEKVRMAIVGSRGISNINIEEYLSQIPVEIECIISGGARGVDTLAAHYAEEKGIKLLTFLPNYQKHLQGAPIRRNELMAKECSVLVAFWDGKSKGTKHIINYAQKLGKRVYVYQP